MKLLRVASPDPAISESYVTALQYLCVRGLGFRVFRV